MLTHSIGLPVNCLPHAMGECYKSGRPLSLSQHSNTHSLTRHSDLPQDFEQNNILRQHSRPLHLHSSSTMEAQQTSVATQAPNELAAPNSKGPFWGSPASFWLMALVFALIHFTVYQTVAINLLAALGGLAICDLFVVIALVYYTSSLQTNATFSRSLARRCILQAVGSGVALGIPIVYALHKLQPFDAAAYVGAILAVTLLVLLLHDILFLGLCWKKLPVWRFTRRSEKPRNHWQEAEMQDV